PRPRPTVPSPPPLHDALPICAAGRTPGAVKAVAACDACGKDYDEPITVTQGQRSGVFDSFECAAHVMAPSCERCGVRILGHGIQVDAAVYCCAHCARHAAGTAPVSDRACAAAPDAQPIPFLPTGLPGPPIPDEPLDRCTDLQ